MSVVGSRGVRRSDQPPSIGPRGWCQRGEGPPGALRLLNPGPPEPVLPERDGPCVSDDWGLWRSPRHAACETGDPLRLVRLLSFSFDPFL